MTAFSRLNPRAICIYFLCALLPVMLCGGLTAPLLALVSGAALYFLFDKNAKISAVFIYAAIIPLCAVINPLFSRSGEKILFFLNGNPITLESVIYGAASGTVIAAVLLWCRSFSAVMDSDRLLYVTGGLSQKLSLIISMALRYVPLYRRQAEKTRSAHRAVGILREDNIPDRIVSGTRVFSGMVTWALENGVVTADSMAARGYGCGKRTRYALYKWRAGDTFLTAAALILCAAYFFLSENFFGYIIFAALCFLPVILEIKERLKWKSLQSKI